MATPVTTVGTLAGKTGRWYGPCRVLWHEPHRSAGARDDGVVLPGSIVWISAGQRLYRVSPEHLRPATDLEEHMEHLGGRSASGLGESILNMPRGLLPGSYIDLTKEDGPDQEQLERAEHYTPKDWSSSSRDEQDLGDSDSEPMKKRGRTLDIPDSAVPQFVPAAVPQFAPVLATPPATPRRSVTPPPTAASGSGSVSKWRRETQSD